MPSCMGLMESFRLWNNIEISIDTWWAFLHLNFLRQKRTPHTDNNQVDLDHWLFIRGETILWSSVFHWFSDYHFDGDKAWSTLWTGVIVRTTSPAKRFWNFDLCFCLWGGLNNVWPSTHLYNPRIPPYISRSSTAICSFFLNDASQKNPSEHEHAHYDGKLWWRLDFFWRIKSQKVSKGEISKLMEERQLVNVWGCAQQRRTTTSGGIWFINA